MTRERNRKTTRQDSLGLSFENLEDRQLLAFDFLFDGTTLTLTQIADDGLATIDNSVAGDVFQVADGAGIVPMEAATNVVVELMDNSNHLSFALENTHSGDVEILAGDGARSILFVGSSNEIGGDLTIAAGLDSQLLSPSHTTELSVGGTIDIDTGTETDLDALNFIHSFSAGGDFYASGPMTIDVQDTMDVDGNLTIDNSGKFGAHTFEKTSASPATIGGDLSYTGNSRADTIDLASVAIGGDFIAKLGDGDTIGVQNQLFALDDVSFENLVLSSGLTTHSDEITWSSVVANGDIDIDLGEGDNSAVLHGVINGDHVSYSGLSGIDEVSYSMAGGVDQQVNVSLGEDIDTFTLFDGSTIRELNVDFGGIQDHFVNAYGDFTFDASLQLDFFEHHYELATDTLSMTEIPNILVGDLTIQSDPVTHRFITSGDEITTASTLNIQMLHNSDRDLALFFEHELGSSNIDLGTGNRDLEFNGVINTYHDGLSIVASAGQQNVFIDNGAFFNVAGDVTIDLGLANDSVFTSGNGLRIDGDLTLAGVNNLENNGLLQVGGNLVFDVSMEPDPHSEFTNLEEMEVVGDMSVYGGIGSEGIGLDGALSTHIHGNLFVDLGGNVNPGPQGVRLSSNAVVGQALTVLSTNDQAQDIVLTDNGSLVGGNTIIDLGDGSNNVILHHQNGGDLIKYTGGQDGDGVLLNTSGTAATINVSLGDDNDALFLEAGVAIDEYLRIDFGQGDDAFVNNMGAFNFDARLLNMAGLNAFYYHIDSQINIVQTEDQGPIQIDNIGPGSAIQLIANGSSYAITPTENLSVDLMSDSDPEFNIELDSPLAGDLILNLRHGDRDVAFVGPTNEIQGDLRIVSGDGQQNILVQSSDLIVGGDAIVNLRDAADSFSDGGNAIQIDGNMILRNVDHFEVSNKLDVGGNMTMVSHWYSQDTRFDNDGTIEIDGRFTYLGSDGRDDVLLNGNTTIGDEIYINLGENVNIGPGQTITLGNGFTAADRLTIQGGTAIGGNNVLTDATTVIGGDMIVDFTGSTTSNTAVLHGQYGGGYGTFRGGDANDLLAFDAIAEDMGWATLMHGGNDEVELGVNTDLLLKHLDLGFGNDILDDNHVNDFPLTILN